MRTTYLSIVLFTYLFIVTLFLRILFMVTGMGTDNHRLALIDVLLFPSQEHDVTTVLYATNIELVL